MKLTVLMGSPRKQGNTNALLVPFMDELHLLGHTTELFWLYDMDIAGCTACRACQKDWTIFGCSIKDDMQVIFDSIMTADHLVMATPIYSWYCTAPMKAALDRLVYGMNKYYGNEKGPSLWAGKKLSLLVTCGYRPEKGADVFETGIQRGCKHSQLVYAGMHAERDLGYTVTFMDDAKEKSAREFARSLVGS